MDILMKNQNEDPINDIMDDALDALLYCQNIQYYFQLKTVNKTIDQLNHF